MNLLALYQAEVARRNKEGVPADEQPSFLSEASYEICPPAGHVVLQATSFVGAAPMIGRPQLRTTISDVEMEPPAISETLLLLLGPKDRVESILGDLEERFHGDLETVSVERARWRYRGRVWRSLGPLIFNKLRDWGLFAFVFELCRRKFGW